MSYPGGGHPPDPLSVKVELDTPKSVRSELTAGRDRMIHSYDLDDR
jgi:hypothetical protein